MDANLRSFFGMALAAILSWHSGLFYLLQEILNIYGRLPQCAF